MQPRKVQKVPLYLNVYLEALPEVTGKTWSEWDRILSTDLQLEYDVLPITQYLIARYKLKPAWAQMIATHYVFGADNASI
ncbi:MAG: hypothetical protein K8L99_21740 [Anaerolineae bacterium]|nr:hypothetical protein [Anaerolineae bacterium]